MLLLNINGPVNSGKTTVSKILETKFSNALFIEVDDLISDEEETRLLLSRNERWTERLSRLQKKLETLKNEQKYDAVIWAYPIGDKSYQRWKTLADAQTPFLNITIAPSLEICLQDRGTRTLTPAEQTRIQEMYQEGYQNRPYSDFIICNDNQSPEQTADIIFNFVKHALNKSIQQLHLVERRWHALVTGEKVSTYRINEGFIHKGFLVYKDYPKEHCKAVVYVTDVYYGPFKKAMEIDGFDAHTPDLQTGLKQMQSFYPNMTADTDILFAKHLSVPETKKLYPQNVTEILKTYK